MSLTGNIETMPLPDVLQFLGLGRKSGVLRIESPTGRKQLYLEDGRAVYCSSGSAKEYLGQHLLARTHLTEADLERAFRLQKESGRRLGEVLVDHGFLTASQIDMVLRKKVEDCVYELFTWDVGRFVFEEGAPPEEDIPLRLSLDWQDLIMEGARRSDELAVIRDVIPGDHVRFRSVRDRFPAGFPRTGGDQRLIQLVEEGCSVGEICPRFHVSDFDILSRLAALVREGLLAVDEVSIEEGRLLGRDELLRCGTRFLEKGHLTEALEIFREGAKRFFEDAAMVEGLRACERRLHKHFLAQTANMLAVPVLRGGGEELLKAPLDAKQAFVATRINGSWTVKSIVQICPFDEMEVLCILDGLVRQGLIEMRIPAAVG